MKQKKLISIIILSYNVKDLLKQTLESLQSSIQYAKDQTKGMLDFETIVVDNNSQDGADLLVQNEFNWVKLVRNKENLGFAHGNNVGTKYISENSNYVAFLNNDLVLQPDTMLTMFEFMEKTPDCGLATCRVDLWSGGLDIDAHRGFPTPWNAFCYFSGLEKLLGKTFPTIFGNYHLLYKDFSTTHEIDACLGAFMIIPKTLGDKIGWWPKEYFLNGEDIDLCFQIKNLQHQKIYWVNDTKVIHYKGASKGTKAQAGKHAKASSSTKNLSINSGINSMKIFYKKYYEKKYPFILTRAIYAGIWLLHQKRKMLGRE
ncbi:glycosyltransferase family 2 protein [Patescibacteria group bacterium]|nr:glycosyltransferase family 2 protein [Patescibacteria group bacterium]